MLTAETDIRPISLPTRHPKRPFSRKFLPFRHPKRHYGRSECQHGRTPRTPLQMPLSVALSARAGHLMPPQVDLVQPVFGRGAKHFRNLNRTFGPTRPILSFTPFLGHGVNDTTPSQKPFWRGMPLFNFRMCGLGHRLILLAFAVLTPKTHIRPISLPTRLPKRPFSRKILPCWFPKHQYRQSECQHGRASNRIPPLDLVQPVFGRVARALRVLPKLKPHFGPHKAHFVVYPFPQSRGKPHPPLPDTLLLGYAVV